MAKPVQTVDSYIAARSPPVRATLKSLRELIHATLPEIEEGMKWGAPVFLDSNGVPVVYLYGGKDHANLGFIHGAELDDPKGLLQGRGESGRHVEIYPDETIPKAALKKFLRQCIESSHP